MFTRIGAAAYKKDLHNTIVLLEALGNPHHRFKSIHLAGTNGKGSCSHMLAAVFHKAGYKTGLYTSPHLYDFRERIKVSGNENLEMISKDFVISFTEKIKPVLEKIEPSFFEVTVAMAFEWFAVQEVDIAIIETGLGGRLDSTNIITPELSIITNIGWDHMNLLGDTLAKIAFEKAGIIKPHVPVVIGEALEETLPVFIEKAKSCEAPVYFASEHWQPASIVAGMEQLQMQMYKPGGAEALDIQCDLPGLYQQYNLCTVLTAVDLLRGMGWSIGEKTLIAALATVKQFTGLWGRWQVIDRNPYVVLDVAHNEAGMVQLLHQVNTMQQQGAFDKVHLIMGKVKDKEAEKVLKLLPLGFTYYFTQAQTERALPAETLQQQARLYHLEGMAYPKPQDALQAARLQAVTKDLIIVCGSIFVVAEIEPQLS